MATLCLLNEDGLVVRHWAIGEKAVTIGRGATVDVQVDDEGLSRRHFMIVRDGDGYLLKDLSSRNGTWMDGDGQMIAPPPGRAPAPSAAVAVPVVQVKSAP
jgi:pSer/pThr/pTyr-binding forkhead associated (FHA) protein